MKKLIIAVFFIVALLFLTATAVPVSAGTEPSPFKGKTILNKLNVAYHKLEKVEDRLERTIILRDPRDDENLRGIVNRIHALTHYTESSCRDLISAQEMFYKGDLDGDQSNNYAEKLNETKERATAIVHRISVYIDTNPDRPAEFNEALMEFYNAGLKVVILLEEHIEEVMGIDPEPFHGKHLQINDISWDIEGQQFVIQMSCRFGLATAGEHADFKIVTNLEIVAGDATFYEHVETGISKVAGAEKDADGFIKLEALRIPLNIYGGWFTGKILFTINFLLLNPGGTGMTQIDPPSLEIDAGIPDDDLD